MLKKLISAVACVASIATLFGSSETSFENGIPSDWSKTANYWSSGTYDGSRYPYPKINTSSPNYTVYARSTVSVPASELPTCDNVVARVTLSNRIPADIAKIDKFQVVVSTNSTWSEIFKIGEPFEYYDPNSTDAWSTHNVIGNVKGLENAAEFYYGIQAIAAGYSSTLVYLGAMSIDFLAGATCNSLSFATEPQIGNDSVIVSAIINQAPADRISSLTVWAEIERSGNVYTNQMFEAADGSWTNDVLKVASLTSPVISAHPLDAGDTLSVTVFTKYVTDMESGAIGEFDDAEGVYVEKSDVVLGYTVPKLGSVWINEFSVEYVELFGTTNRTYLGGWKLQLVDSDSQVVSEKSFQNAFDFTTNMPNRMIGMEVHSLNWPVDSLKGVYTLRLINSAGIVEHEETNVVFSSASQSFGMAGIAAWTEDGYSYDWSGTPENGTFESWGALVESSFGFVNRGEYFETEAKGWFKIKTVITDESEHVEPFSYANVNYTIDLSGSPYASSLQTSSNGWSEVESFTGTHTNDSAVHASFDVSAFGWYSESLDTIFLLNETNIYERIILTPTVATDGFDSGTLGSHWINAGTSDYSYREDSGNGFARANLRYNNPGSKYAELKCGNYLRTRGLDCAEISFAVCNRGNTDTQKSDWAYVQIATNISFSSESIVATSMSLYNRTSGVALNTWNRGSTFVKLPDAVDASTPLYVRIQGFPGGYSSVYLDVDDIRIAFEDIAMMTNLVRSVAAPVNNGSSGFAIDILPQTRDVIEEVSADLHLILNGVTNIVPFAYADGTQTNNIALVNGEAESVRMTIPEDALVEALGYPFLTGDEVQYFAAVHYNSNNGDTDPTKVYETRYFPDNTRTSVIDGRGCWVVEGEYVVNSDLSAQSFTVTGPALSCIGMPEVTTEGVKFSIHGYDQNGISSLTVNVNGVDYHPFDGLDTNVQVRVTGEFVLPTGLSANTEYTVTISATDSNNSQITPSVFTFVTLPEAPSAVIEAISTNEVRLTVSGSAAGYVVPAGWTQTSLNTWTRNDGTPNSLVSATGIYGTNKLGQASATIDATPAYTLAAVATKAPVVVKGETTVTVSAGGDYALTDDGNPEGTEYAVRVTTSNDGDAFVSTNDVAVWKTLNEWKADEPLVVASPTIDLEATNYFSFVTRNFDEVPTENSTPVTTNCWFDMAAGFVGSPAQKGAASQDDASFGKVALSVEFFDPAQGDGAVASIEYRIDRGEWTPWLNIPVSFDELSVTTNLDWDAWVAVGRVQGEYVYNLRAKVSAGNRESAWAVFDEGSLDFAPPTNLAISGSPANAETTSATGYDFSFSATDSNDVAFGWTLTGGTHGTGGTAAGGNLPDGSYTLTVTATDAMGNVCDAVNRNWTVDTTSPTGLAFVVAPEDGAVTNLASFSIAASADDATALTYHWALNGIDAAGTAATYVGEAREGTNTVSVYVEDAAGNVCSAVTRTWVVDTIAPTAPVITGKPATLTNTPAFTMDAASDDATALTYHWTFNGSGFVGASLADNAREGSNSVNVYATDEAGNVSETTSYSWTLDTTAPSGLAISGTPAQGAVTANSAVGLTASATDAHAITYRWTFNGVASEGAALNATAQEGANTASVVAIDAAGNACAAVTRTWTLDTTKPANLAVEGTPTDGSLVNLSAFSFTASASDATSLSYHWTLNGVVANTTSDAFAGTAAEGENTVSVYAEDAAGNKSDESTVTWTLDTTAPTGLAIGGTPAQGATTADSAVSLTASATDVHAITYRWTFNGVASEGAALNATAKEGLNTASVVAVDAAGNASAAVTRTWTLDTTAPSNLAVEGAPATGSIVNVSEFDFTASASDATTITYHWTFGEETAEVTNFTGKVSEDGEYTVSVYAEDAAGNKSESVAVSWTLDTVAPDGLAINGTPAQGATTANSAVSLTASATDVHAITYRWTFNGVASEGTALNATAKEGLNTASVVAVDAAGNACAAVTRTWTLDTIKPTTPVISGTPSNGMVVNSSAIDLVAASEDATTVTYHWTFGEETAVVTNFTGTASEDGAYTISVYAEDAAGNKSDAASIAWTLDSTAPTEPEISGKPATITNVKNFTLSASSTDATALVYTWTFNGAVSTGPSLSGTAVEGENIVRVYATDAGGNVSPTNSYSWTLDTTAPTEPQVVGAPAEVTNLKTFTLTASGTTDAHEFTYNWIFGGQTAVGETFDVTTVNDGDYEVKVYAVDAAGNSSTTNTVAWTLDTTAPSTPIAAGLPGAITNVKTFTLTASGTTDTHEFTYNWIFGEQTAVGETFAVVTEDDGEYEVFVYALDAAGNSSETNSVAWTLDTTAPSKPTIAGLPGALTKVKTFTLTASGSTDAHDITYRWTFGGANSTGAELNVTTVSDGDYTASVVAVDAAGNVSEAAAVSWTLDATAPTEPQVSGAPGAITNVKTFTLTASGTTDAHEFAYNWIFGEETATGETFDVETESEGDYEVLVYALDAAGNSSTTNTVAWTLDTTAPSKPTIAGLPGALTKVKTFTLTASGSTDAHDITYRWTLNGAAAGTGDEFNVETTVDGFYTASVVAVDAAGNESVAESVIWTLDATAPTEPQVAGAPDAVTNVKTFTLTASGTTDAHEFTYNWIFGEETATGETFDVAVEDDGDYEVLVYALDAAGNSSTTNAVVWALDTTPPSEPEVTGLPGEVTNVKSFTLTASGTTDAHEFTYNWIFGEQTAVGGTFSVVTENDGEYEVFVYALDAAGNSSTTNSVGWRLDTSAPTVTLSSDTPDPFKASDTFVVTVEFSEPVVGFTNTSITVVNGSVGEVVESQEPESSGKVFTVTIVPQNDDVTSMSVQILAGEVTDSIGNGNEASNVITRNCVLKRPTVGLSTTLTTDFFHMGEVFGVSVVFSQAVTNFSAASVTVVNGTVAVSGSGAEYTMTVTPAADGEVSVQIGENKVYDSAGNGNVASATLKKTYDNTAPTGIVLSGTPENGSETYTREYSITVQSVVEANASAGLVYQWSVDGGSYKTGNVTLSGTAAPGEHTVKVRIRDKAGNWSLVDHSPTWTWAVLESETSADVEFGDGICVKVDPETGATNSVSFTSVNFKPGQASTFVMEGFDASTQQIEDFSMWFVVRDTLNGTERRVKVNPDAEFDSEKGELTVTIPASAIEGKNSLFIFGIDNKGE